MFLKCRVRKVAKRILVLPSRDIPATKKKEMHASHSTTPASACDRYSGRVNSAKPCLGTLLSVFGLKPARIMYTRSDCISVAINTNLI